MFIDAPGNDDFTKLLLHFDAPNGSTTFKDFSASNHTVTVGGGAHIDTSQSVFGGSSLRLNGTNAFLLLDGSADFAFGLGPWAIDFWMRPNAVGTVQTLYDSRLVNSEVVPDIYLAADGSVRYFVSGADQIISSAILSNGVWYHIAVARLSGTTRLSVNGTLTGAAYADGNNYGNNAGRPTIGVLGVGLATFFFDGWIDEFRVSTTDRGMTSAFTPSPCSYG